MNHIKFFYKSGGLATLLIILIVGLLPTQTINAQDDSRMGPHEVEWLAHQGEADPILDLTPDAPIQPLVSLRRDPSHVIFGYHPYWNGTSYTSYNYDLLTHLAYFGVEMNSSGQITNSHSWPVTSLINLAHSNGVKVILTVTLFDNAGIGTLVGNASYRQAAIDNLITRVIQGNADGVNIDFESVPAGSKTNFNIFIHDLTQAFHDQIPGSETSIAMPSVDWSSSYDYEYLNENCDGLMIMAYAYYWGGSSSAGPVAPLYNGGMASYNIDRTVNSYLTATSNDGSNIFLGLPWYGYNWPVSSTAQNATTTGTGSSIVYSVAEPAANSYGKHYNTDVHSAWYNYTASGQQRQVWYDDSLSLVTKYNYAKTRQLAGIGIWALGYDGNRPEIWGGLNDAFGASTPPLSPGWFYVKNIGDGNVLVHAANSANAESYQLYRSQDAQNFELFREAPSPAFLIDSLPIDTIQYFKLKALNTFGASDFTEVLAVSPFVGQSEVLIVNGFERVSGTTNTFDFVKEHGPAIFAAGYHFDSASNDAIPPDVISLTDYDFVDWISGEEATSNTAFSGSEMDAISVYLESGGRLIISGSEIGWDLEAVGAPQEIDFYHNYFKADYFVDDAGSYEVQAMASGLFNGIPNFHFDDGTHGTYDVDYPDGIKPYGGSISNLHFAGIDYTASGGAGIQYRGPFGTSNIDGGLVYLSFGFETIYPASVRENVMSRMLEYLAPGVSIENEQTTTIPISFTLGNAYPNPFNGAVSVPFTLHQSGHLNFAVYDIRGALVFSTNGMYGPGESVWHWNGQSQSGAGLSSGTYWIVAWNEMTLQRSKVTFLK